MDIVIVPLLGVIFLLSFAMLALAVYLIVNGSHSWFNALTTDWGRVIALLICGLALFTGSLWLLEIRLG